LNFTPLSFSRQFMLAIVAVLLVGMTIIGSWIGRQIESSAINRAASIAAVYVESILATQLHGYASGGELSTATHAALDRVFVDGPLRRKVVRFKLWDTGGRIIYSSDRTQLGQSYPVEGELAAALAGELQASISKLDDPDNLPERERWPQLLEVYVPIRTGTPPRVSAVAEFYHSTENLDRDIRTAQQRSWLLVAAATAGLYLLLRRMVHRASDTIVDQQRDLRRQLQQLRSALDDNERMRERLREAGARTTALNEQFLHRVAADLHDGPAQDIAFALLRFDTLADSCSCIAAAGCDSSLDVRNTRNALHSALAELRTIAAGLSIPGIADLSLAETVRRAVRDFERKSGKTVRLDVDDALGEAPLAAKITTYRLLQESLNNAWLHARGAEQKVCVRRDREMALIEVSDQGSGFDPQATAASGRLGLAFMRERVGLLGGSFALDSAPGQGTRIVAQLPLSLETVPGG